MDKWSGERHGGQVYRFDFKGEKWRKVWMLFDGGTLCFSSSSSQAKPSFRPALIRNLRIFYPTLSAVARTPVREAGGEWHFFALDFRDSRDDACAPDLGLSPTHIFRVRSRQDHNKWVEVLRTSSFVVQAEEAAQRNSFSSSPFILQLVAEANSAMKLVATPPTSPVQNPQRSPRGAPGTPILARRQHWSSSQVSQQTSSGRSQHRHRTAAVSSPVVRSARVPSAVLRSPPIIPQTAKLRLCESSLTPRPVSGPHTARSRQTRPRGNSLSNTASSGSRTAPRNSISPRPHTYRRHPSVQKLPPQHSPRSEGVVTDPVPADLLTKLTTLESERDEAYMRLQAERDHLKDQRKAVEDREAELLVMQTEMDQEVRKRQAEVAEKFSEERREWFRAMEKEVKMRWEKLEKELAQKDNQLAVAREEITNLRKELAVCSSSPPVPYPARQRSLSPVQPPTIGGAERHVFPGGPEMSPPVAAHATPGQDATSPLAQGQNADGSTASPVYERGQATSPCPSNEIKQYVSKDLDYQKQVHLEALENELEDLLGSLEPAGVSPGR
eukprot:Hpha_TRINITY_DN34576_c0_g1::TRINITY_DN34576_c0_g1_i1::g.96319::m.96319